jgi:hypothetical protein
LKQAHIAPQKVLISRQKERNLDWNAPHEPERGSDFAGKSSAPSPACGHADHSFALDESGFVFVPVVVTT